MHINIIVNMITVSRAAAGLSVMNYDGVPQGSVLAPSIMSSDRFVKFTRTKKRNRQLFPELETERASGGKLTEWRYVDFHLFLLRKEHVFKKQTRFLMCDKRDCVLF